MLKIPQKRAWNCRLTLEQVIEIRKSEKRRRKLYKEWKSLSRRSMARKYGVSETTIADIALNRRWRWFDANNPEKVGRIESMDQGID